jgi:hypothetical protein
MPLFPIVTRSFLLATSFIPFGIVWNGNYVIESDLILHYQSKPVAAVNEAGFNLARDCGGRLLPNSANRYDVAEPQLFVLTFFSI